MNKKQSNNIYSIWAYWRKLIYEHYNILLGGTTPSPIDRQQISRLLKACNRDGELLRLAMGWFVRYSNLVSGFSGTPSLRSLWGWRMTIIPASQNKIKLTQDNSTHQHGERQTDTDRDSVRI